MNCDEVFARLQDYLDRELTTAEIAQVEAHLAECPPCADEYRFEESVLRYMKGGFREMPIPDDLERRCLEALDDSAQP